MIINESATLNVVTNAFLSLAELLLWFLEKRKKKKETTTKRLLMFLPGVKNNPLAKSR